MKLLPSFGVELVTTSLNGPLCGRVNNWDDHAVNHHVFDAMKARRAQIPLRTMRRSPNNNAGYDYDPNKDTAATDYVAWEKTALPKNVSAVIVLLGWP